MTVTQDVVAVSHSVTSRVEVWSGTDYISTVYPVSGSVTVDARRAIRRTCSLTLVDYDGTITPLTSSALLAPGNNELRVYRTVSSVSRTVEAALGVFTITDVSLDASDSGVTIDLECEDRSREVADAKWRSPKKLTSGANVATALTDLLTDARILPSSTLAIATTTRTVPSTHAITLGIGTNANPWADIETVALAAGFEVYFDEAGTFVADAHPAFGPSLTRDDAVVIFEAGSRSTLLGARRSLSASGVSNVVRVVAEGSGIPLDSGAVPAGEASDTDTKSPTNVTDLGERVVEISTPMVATSADAAAIAALLLPARVGWPVELEVIPNPSLDARDIIWLTDPRIGVDSAVVIDALNIPLDAGGSSTITGRVAKL